MKKFILMALVASAAAIYQPAKAQVSVNINIGAQPQWGPRGYDYVDYYYLPEIQSYYNVPTRQFIYLDGNRWVHRKYLPAKYRNYNLYQGRKIVINQRTPYLQHRVHYANYSRRSAVNYGRSNQVYVIKNKGQKPYKAYESHGHGNGKHKGGKH